jgi:nucleoid-associated protein YgaU
MLTRQRCAVVALVATTLAAAALRLLAGWWPSADPVVGLCLAALVAATTWAWLATLSAVGEAWRGCPARRRTTLRRVVFACCGVALAAPAAGASADEQQPLPPAPASVAGLPFPDRAVGPAHPPASGRTRTVVVEPGDCLWHLAAAGLPADATPAEITARWREIYRLNRTLIGADPDLIEPGQRLVVPR